MAKNKKSRGCLSRLVSLLVGASLVWVGVIAPHWNRIEIERDAEPVLRHHGALSAAAHAERWAALASVLETIDERGAALRRFDAWRTTPVEFAGRTFVPWDAMRERSDAVQAADDAADAALLAFDSVAEARAALEARAARLPAFEEAVARLRPWPTPARLDAAEEAARELRADLLELQAAMTPIAEGLLPLSDRIEAASAWLESTAAADLLPGQRAASARAAIADLVTAAGAPLDDLEAAFDELNADVAALDAIIERADAWWTPPPGASEAAGRLADGVDLGE